MTDHFVPEAVAGSVGLAGVLALWRDAQARGWLTHVDPDTEGWRAYVADRTAGMSYQPPSDVVCGVVHAYDHERTSTLTGVAGPLEAVAHIRAFFGWPDIQHEIGAGSAAD